jgi:glucose-6-phosphate 1-dehydrogenase
VVRGQFRGYLEEDGVAPGSRVETFAAVAFHIDSWRWAGVPFFVRAGKRLPETVTEVLVTLRRPPQTVFPEPDPGDPNTLHFRLSPEVVIAIGARAKLAGEAMRGEPVELSVRHQHPEQMEPYERLIGDAIAGDPALFARQDSVEAAWAVVDPVLGTTATPVHVYEPGTWGPPEADRLIGSHGPWHCPEPCRVEHS